MAKTKEGLGTKHSPSSLYIDQYLEASVHAAEVRADVSDSILNTPRDKVTHIACVPSIANVTKCATGS